MQNINVNQIKIKGDNRTYIMKIKRKIKRLKTNFVKNIDKCAIESINFIKYIYIYSMDKEYRSIKYRWKYEEVDNQLLKKVVKIYLKLLKKNLQDHCHQWNMNSLMLG